jgi:sialic acid synthase SpsE
MIDAIKAIDTGKHEVVLKFQLSLPDGINVPLDHDVFDYGYRYGNEQGYKVTSSVADLESLKFLLQYDVCFVKIPNDRGLDWLIGYVSRMIPVYVSCNDSYMMTNIWCNEWEYKDNITPLACISKYPATIEEYEHKFQDNFSGHLARKCPISDHTIDFTLWHKYHPSIIEWHFKLEDSTGLDAGPFAIMPEELRKIL